MSDDILENAIVAAQDQYGDPPAKYAPGNNMPASVTVPIMRRTLNQIAASYGLIADLPPDRQARIDALRPDRRHFDAVLARSLGWVSPDDHDRRVTELLNANNKLIEDRRALEAKTVDLIKTILRALPSPSTEGMIQFTDAAYNAWKLKLIQSS